MTSAIPVEPFSHLDDAQRFIEQRVYDRLRQTGEWPKARDFDLAYCHLFDPLGGLQLVCKLAGHDRISCDSPLTPNGHITLRWSALADLSEAADDIANFLAAVRLGAQRYHSSADGAVQLSVTDLTNVLHLDNLASKRAIELIREGNSISSGGGPGYVALTHQISRMRDVSTLDDYLARVAADVKRRQAIARFDRGDDRPVPRPPKRIFLSHAAADAALAHHLANVLRQGAPDLEVFVASKAGDIPTGADWLEAIESALEQADTYLLLLTPRSILRTWFWYESGAAWMSDRPFIPVTAAGLPKGDVPYPLGAKQALSLEEATDVEQLARDLGLAIPDAPSFCATMRDVSKALPPAARETFLGVNIGGRWFDWDGPLHQLAEWDPIPAPAGLEEALRASNVEPLFCDARNVRAHLSQGFVRVHATDRSTWRRDVLKPGEGSHVLIVRPGKT